MSIETLYNLYKTPFFSLAYRMLGSVMDAEDIVQEAFLAYDQLSDSSVIQNERAFLYKIVTNTKRPGRDEPGRDGAGEAQGGRADPGADQAGPVCDCASDRGADVVVGEAVC